jgi:hypothetical protein
MQVEASFASMYLLQPGPDKVKKTLERHRLALRLD